jgi:hypothetical protein
MRRGAGIEIHQVIVGAPDPVQRGFGPDDAHGPKRREAEPSRP